VQKQPVNISRHIRQWDK